MTARKVMLLGAIGVGKSSLVRRLVLDRFEADYLPTIGVNIYNYRVADAGPGPLDLIIWDTDGNFGEAIFEHSYIKGAAGAVIVADISRPATLTAMADLARGFAERLPGRTCALVVNKTDLVPDPGPGALPADVRLPSLPLAFASAKSGVAVKDVFHDVAVRIARREL
jgi:Ras-related protein Rab-22